MIVDFRKEEAKTHTPVYTSEAEVEQVSSSRFLGITITENLSHHASPCWFEKNYNKRRYFLWKLRKATVQSKTLVIFYRGAIGSILTLNLKGWFMEHAGLRIGRLYSR